MDLTKFHKNAKFFEDNREKFLNLYYGKYLLISEENLAAVYENHNEAYYSGLEQCGHGNFFIKQCIPASEERVEKITRMLIKP